MTKLTHGIPTKKTNKQTNKQTNKNTRTTTTGMGTKAKKKTDTPTDRYLYLRSVAVSCSSHLLCVVLLCMIRDFAEKGDCGVTG